MDKDTDATGGVVILGIAALVLLWKVIVAILVIAAVFYVIYLLIEDDTRTLGIVLGSMLALMILVGIFSSSDTSEQSQPSPVVHTKKHKINKKHIEVVAKDEVQQPSYEKSDTVEIQHTEETAMNLRSPEERLEEISGEKLN